MGAGSVPEPKKGKTVPLGEEDYLREAMRKALEGIRRLSVEEGVQPPPSVADEIVPGIIYEDVGIKLAGRTRPRRTRRSEVV